MKAIQAEAKGLSSTDQHYIADLVGIIAKLSAVINAISPPFPTPAAEARRSTHAGPGFTRSGYAASSCPRDACRSGDADARTCSCRYAGRCRDQAGCSCRYAGRCRDQAGCTCRYSCSRSQSRQWHL